MALSLSRDTKTNPDVGVVPVAGHYTHLTLALSLSRDTTLTLTLALSLWRDTNTHPDVGVVPVAGH